MHQLPNVAGCSFCPKPRYEREEQPITNEQQRFHMQLMAVTIAHSKREFVRQADRVIESVVDQHRRAHGEQSLGEYTWFTETAFRARRKPLVCA